MITNEEIEILKKSEEIKEKQKKIDQMNNINEFENKKKNNV